jgi:hypothetical protein
MKHLKKTIARTFLLTLLATQALGSPLNQTDTVSPILVNAPLPFSISIEAEDYQVPGGMHSGAIAQYKSMVLYIAGRTNGLHGFNNSNDNFPPQQQNTSVIVIDLNKKTVYSRSLNDPFSGLTQEQIDTLSVTSPQYYQSGKTLYITGGYGVDTFSGDFSTKDTLTAIDVPGLINWVIRPVGTTLASNSIRQIFNPIFQVTGGQMCHVDGFPTLLIFGQNFQGFYTSLSNGDYTQQVRRFDIFDDGTNLGVSIRPPTEPDPSYRRRDLNVIPIMECPNVQGFIVLSGVFTIPGGIWTVPVEITANGIPSMANPNLPTTFRQGMNNYASAHAELFSKKGDMYALLFGGLTYEFYQDGAFSSDEEIPFTNQVTCIKRTKGGVYNQFLLPTEYPVIFSTQSNPGNLLLFGAGAKFVNAPGIAAYANNVLKLKKIKKPTVIGYIIGGIQSTLPNTNDMSDSAASPYIFRVTLTPTC